MVKVSPIADRVGPRACQARAWHDGILAEHSRSRACPYCLPPSQHRRHPGYESLRGSMAGLCAPLADASLSPSRMTAHGSGPMRFATPSSYRTCTDYSLPVSGALRKTLDNYRCYYLAIDVETSRGRRYRRRTQSRFNQSSNYEGDVACSGRSTNLKLIARSLAIITFSAKS